MRWPRGKPELEPTQIDFGYGFVVKIEEAPKALRGADGQWEGIGGKHGMKIRLSPGLPLWRRHEMIAHEAVHAALDFFQWLHDELVKDLKEEEEE